MNPQIRFGEDLMSRVSYVMLHPGSVDALARAVRGCLNGLVAELTAEAGFEPTDVLEVTLVGNPVMHHLALGIDPTELGGAPFALATDLALRLRAAEDLALGVHPGARAYRCRASPATWAPTPPGCCWPRRRRSGTTAR